MYSPLPILIDLPIDSFLCKVFYVFASCWLHHYVLTYQSQYLPKNVKAASYRFFWLAQYREKKYFFPKMLKILYIFSRICFNLSLIDLSPTSRLARRATQLNTSISTRRSAMFIMTNNAMDMVIIRSNWKFTTINA